VLTFFGQPWLRSKVGKFPDMTKKEQQSDKTLQEGFGRKYTCRKRYKYNYVQFVKIVGNYFMIGLFLFIFDESVRNYARQTTSTELVFNDFTTMLMV